MSLEQQHLVLLLDAPIQSWGFASRFQRRTTGMHPTKSGVIGLVAAAIGIDKHSAAEAGSIEALGKLRLTAITLPRLSQSAEGSRPIRRLEDYHTVEGTRRASGKIDAGTVQTYRHYLLDARFGVILALPPQWQLPDGHSGEFVAACLQDPVWGVWFGRKCCLPATPIFVAGPLQSFEQSWQALLRAVDLPQDSPIGAFNRVEEAGSFGEGVDTITDQPLTFARPNAHTPRRVRVIAASI